MEKLKIHKKKIFSFLMILFSLILLAEVSFLLQGNVSEILKISNDTTFKKHADYIIKLCAGERYHPACYDREIPKLMDQISMSDVFEVTRIIQVEDSTYPYCHVLGHELAAREVNKDPSKWKDVVSMCPAGMCSNGCLHGGFQERFRSETFTDVQIEMVKPDLATICEKRSNWNPTGLEQASCYHAVGHLSMYLTGADIYKAGELCNYAALKSDGRNFTQTCLDGTFMQIFQPLEPDDFALIAGKEVKRDELKSFCMKFQGQQRTSCWHEGWPLYVPEITKPDGLMNYCNSSVLSTDADKDQCFLSLFYVLMVQFNFDTKKVQIFCSALPEKRLNQCFANTASRLIETDYRNINEVAAYCAAAPTLASQAACYDEMIIYSTFNFHAGSPEFYKLCNVLPEDWKNKCLNNAPQ